MTGCSSAQPQANTVTRNMIIDPPFGAFDWTMTGTVFGTPTELKGCSLFVIDVYGKIWRYWMNMDSAQMLGP